MHKKARLYSSFTSVNLSSLGFFSGTLGNRKGESIENLSSITEYIYTNCDPHNVPKIEKNTRIYFQNHFQFLILFMQPSSYRLSSLIFLDEMDNKLEALRERRPPWPRQIITLILPTVKMLSLGCERLPTSLKKNLKKKKKKKKGSGSLPAPRSGYATTITVVFFAHLLILQYPDHHQNLISSSLYYSGPVHKISSQSVHNFLSNVVHRQTDKQTN